MSLRLVTAPAAMPATTAEAREWCRIDSDDTSQDAVIDILIAAATQHAEHLTGRAFVERTYELNLPYFTHCIELPMAPLLGIDSIKYTDTSENEQTVAAADYEADVVGEPGRVRPVWNASWPSTGHGFNPVRIQYRAGYAYVGSPVDYTDNSYLPAALRQWLAVRIATLYDNRAQVSMLEKGSMVTLPRDLVDALLDPLVVGTRLF